MDGSFIQDLKPTVRATPPRASSSRNWRAPQSAYKGPLHPELDPAGRAVFCHEQPLCCTCTQGYLPGESEELANAVVPTCRAAQSRESVEIAKLAIPTCKTASCGLSGGTIPPLEVGVELVKYGSMWT